MTIRFAAANRGGFNAFVAPMFVASIPLRAANDNMHGTSNDKLLKAALRHFAEHGLCAAEHARENAERAFFEGDRPGRHSLDLHQGEHLDPWRDLGGQG